MKDLPGTVRAVAKMGYQVVEFYSPYYSWTTDQAKDVRKLLDDLGIKCLSTHNGPQAISRRRHGQGRRAQSDHRQQVHHRRQRRQGLGRRRLEGVRRPRWRRAAEKLRAHKMATGFHNHQVEWKPLEGGERPMDILAKNTPKDVVLQLDAGTAIEVGADPVAWIKANPGRIKSIHLKDWGKGDGAATPWRSAKGTCRGSRSSTRRSQSAASSTYLIEQEHAGARRRARDGAAVLGQLQEDGEVVSSCQLPVSVENELGPYWTWRLNS